MLQSVAAELPALMMVAKAVAAENHIFVPQGVHVIDNPLVIDRDTPLFIHGADRAGTLLVAKDPKQPLLVVKRAPLVNLAGLPASPFRTDRWRRVGAGRRRLRLP